MDDFLVAKETRLNSKALPYDLPFMTEEFQKRAELELFEDEETRTKSLKQLRIFLKEEKLCYLDEDIFLLAFLRARKFDVRRTSDLIKTFHKIKTKHKELFHHFDFSDVKRTLKDNSAGFFPLRDQEGCCILLIHIERWNTDQNNLGDLMRVLTAGLIHAVLSPCTQVAGIKVIVDFKGLTLTKLTYVTPRYFRLFTEALQNTFPARFKAVHFVNETSFVAFIWGVMKPLLSSKLKHRFIFHGKDINKLHDYFSPDILPEEYNGHLPPFDNSEWARKLSQTSDYITRILRTAPLETKN